MNVQILPLKQAKLSALPPGSLFTIADHRTFGMTFDYEGKSAVVFKQHDKPLLHAVLAAELDDDVLHLHEAEVRARPADLRSYAVTTSPRDLPKGALLFQDDQWLVRTEPSSDLQASGSARFSLQTFKHVKWGGSGKPVLYFASGWQLLLITDPTRPEFDQKIWDLRDAT